MKIYQYVVSESERFMKNVKKELPNNVKEFIIDSFSMRLTSSRGRYKFVLNLFVNSYPIDVNSYTNDSTVYDYYTDLEYGTNKWDNWAKKNILGMLSNKGVKDLIEETAIKHKE